MKKLKKVFAVLLTLAMVLGMSMTSFAAPAVAANGIINVSGLKAEATEVYIYNVVKPDNNGNAWVVAEWAKGIKTTEGKDIVDATTNPYTINVDELAGLVTDGSADQHKPTSNGSVQFTGLEAGVYLVIAKTTAQGSTTTYKPMLAVTYNRGATGTGLSGDYLVAAAANIVAKSASIQVDKSSEEDYVAVGTNVPFTITTTFPSFHDENGANRAGRYKIVDTPTNLSILEDTVAVEVGGVPVTKNTDYTVAITSGVMTIEFTSAYIGRNNDHAGATVEVSYDATVTGLTGGIKNTANSVVDDDTVGGGDEEVFPGSITITKYAENGTTPLNGAEFIVYTTRAGKTVYAVTDTNGNVTGWTETENEASHLTTAGQGTATINGLDADETYYFKEVVAPDGYSVEQTPSEARWTPLGDGVAATNRKGSAEMVDTPLAGLPSTGGIGTTIFTIGGCVIMIAAAALFFASRRKSAK